MMHTTNDARAFIEVAEHRNAEVGTVPPAKAPPAVARLQYEMLVEDAYRFTSDEVVFRVYARRAGVPYAGVPAARDRELAGDGAMAHLAATRTARRRG